MQLWISFYQLKHLAVSGSDREGELHASNQEWLFQKIVQCVKAVGVTVDESKEGWASVIDFAQYREYQMDLREELV